MSVSLRSPLALPTLQATTRITPHKKYLGLNGNIGFSAWRLGVVSTWILMNNCTKGRVTPGGHIDIGTN